MRVLILKKKTLIKIAACAMVLIAACIYIACAAGDAATAFSDNGLVLTHVDDADSAVALTFDTAFGEDKTDEILEILKKKGAKATFAVMGKWAEENPQSVENIIKDGHEVISHSMTHERYDDLGSKKAVEDAIAAREFLKLEHGVETDLIRMPYGAGSDTVTAALVESGFVPVGWSIDSQDWRSDGADAIVGRVLNNAKNGSIIVMQNNNEQTVEALEQMIDGLYELNLECVTVSRLGGSSK